MAPDAIDPSSTTIAPEGNTKRDWSLWPLSSLSIAVIIIGCVALGITGAYLGLTQRSNTGGEFPSGAVSYEFVKSRPESQLFYPGAEVFHQFGGSEAGNIITGPTSSAFAGAILTTNDSSGQIYQWYREQLLPSEWKPTDFLLADTQLSIQGYERGNREKFYVAINEPSRLSRTLGRLVPAGVTVFEFRYHIVPSAWIRR